MPEGVEPLQQKTLRRLLAIARQLGASSDLRQILSVIIDAMRDLLDAERATVFERDRRRVNSGRGPVLFPRPSP